MDKPTNEQLELTRDVIEWIVAHTEKNEPYAREFIECGNNFLASMPVSQDEISDF